MINFENLQKLRESVDTFLKNEKEITKDDIVYIKKVISQKLETFKKEL